MENPKTVTTKTFTTPWDIKMCQPQTVVVYVCKWNFNCMGFLFKTIYKTDCLLLICGHELKGILDIMH